MKLTDKDLQEMRQTFEKFNDDKNQTVLTVTLARMGLDCLDVIESQYQENEQLMTELNDIKIHTMEMIDGKINMTIESPKAKLFIASIVQIFRQNGAINFFTIDVADTESGEKYSVTIQKHDGITPGEKLRQKDEQLESLTAEKDELIKVLKQARESLQAAWEDDGSTTVGKQILETIKAIDELLKGE